MMRALGTLAATLLLYACTPPAPANQQADSFPTPLISATEYLTPETRAQQNDAFENPGFLWVDRGEALFNEGEAACATCHDSLKGVAATYPKVDPATGDLLNLEARINQCRIHQQNREPLAYDSDDLLALTVYLTRQSDQMPKQVSITGPARPHYEKGRDLFFLRQGQLNLSCANCHDGHWGKRLRGDTISQGHGNAFPAYRLEWQSLGSLHRRFQDCNAGVRAAQSAPGSPDYLALELYLARRAGDLPIESPAIRR